MRRLYILITFLFGMSSIEAQNYVSTIPNYEIYKSLRGKPLSNKFSNIESVKIIYSLQNKKSYYFNSSLIRLHYDFVTNYLGYDKGLEKFNSDNYNDIDKKREFLLGNLNHIKGTDKWILELAASDHMSAILIEQFYKLIEENTFIGKKLSFYLNNQNTLDLYNKNKFKIPCVKSDYIFNELKYQEVVTGINVGILKQYKIRDLDSIMPKFNEIIILDGTPETLPNVKGIIVNELQTPLSHLVILGKNRKIPIMAYKNVLNDFNITKLLNKKVELKIESDTFFVNETNKKIIGKKNFKNPKKLTLNTNVKDIVDLSKISKKGIDFMGAKAQNLSYLIAISKNNSFKVPECAHAIPFYFYIKHTQKKPISILIDELLNSKYKDSTKWVNNQLQKIRKAIKKETIDKLLINKLNEELGNQNIYKSFRFRSSTNAEDIEGFNGAGLYESKTGIYGDSIKSFEKAIKQVWSSVWNESSYWERELFGIDQRDIAMGVLVHRAFPDELANGVVITKNLFRDNFSGITVNIQKDENSVVKPNKDEICEQFSIYDLNLFESANPNFDVDYVSHSNLNKNKPLLSSAEINNLYKVSKNIESRMNKYWNKFIFKPVDLEFKIVGEQRDLYIKQVRVFND